MVLNLQIWTYCILRNFIQKGQLLVKNLCNIYRNCEMMPHRKLSLRNLQIYLSFSLDESFIVLSLISIFLFNLLISLEETVSSFIWMNVSFSCLLFFLHQNVTILFLSFFLKKSFISFDKNFTKFKSELVCYSNNKNKRLL